jgi:hypothetical protein
MARGYARVTATIAAQNTFTDHIHPADKPERPYLNLSVSGVSDSTVTLQRTFDGGTTWLDVESYTADAEKVIEGAHEGAEAYRVGVKTGDYGSDTVLVRLSH